MSLHIKCPPHPWCQCLAAQCCATGSWCRTHCPDSDSREKCNKINSHQYFRNGKNVTDKLTCSISYYQFLWDFILLCKMRLLQRQTQLEFLSETKISLFVCSWGSRVNTDLWSGCRHSSNKVCRHKDIKKKEKFWQRICHYKNEVWQNANY